MKSLLFLLVVVFVLGCRSYVPEQLIGCWRAVAYQDSPEDSVYYFGNGTELIIVSSSEGREEANGFLFDKITKNKLRGTEEYHGNKEKSGIIYYVDKIDSNSLELRFHHHEGYKVYYERCK